MDVEKVERLASMSNDGFLRGPTLQLCAEYRHLIEQHDAKMREVSEVVSELLSWPSFDTTSVRHRLSRFILPDPVKSITDELDHILATGTADQMADWLGENAPAIREALTITKEPNQ